MAFPEKIRMKVLERAHFSCCVCQRASLSIEVHHIIPTSSGGLDTEDNAAPLCPSCHADYGDNVTKSKAIRERRDFWYETCSKREQPKTHWVEMADRLNETATKKDLQKMTDAIISEMSGIINQQGKPIYQIKAELSSFANTATSGTLYRISSCPKCHNPITLSDPLSGGTRCPSCGHVIP